MSDAQDDIPRTAGQYAHALSSDAQIASLSAAANEIDCHWRNPPRLHVH